MKNSTPKNVFLISYLFLCLTVFVRVDFAQSPPLLLDTNFNAGVSGGADNVKAISLQPDGKILVGGDFRFAADAPHHALARFNMDGSIDDSFHPALSVGSVVEAIPVSPDGKILISGNFTASVDAHPIFGLVRLNSDGSFDRGFAANLSSTYSAEKMALQTDGKIVGAGYSNFNGRTSPALSIRKQKIRDSG